MHLPRAEREELRAHYSTNEDCRDYTNQIMNYCDWLLWSRLVVTKPGVDLLISDDAEPRAFLGPLGRPQRLGASSLGFGGQAGPC
jgi:hypothetical protein